MKRIEEVFTLPEAIEAAQGLGATHFSRLYLKKYGLFSVSFFKGNVPDEEGCLQEVASWSVDFDTLMCYFRKFSTALIKEGGFSPLEEI